MSEHPYKPQPWRLTEYYPEAYARFMDTLNDGIVPDWNDDDHDRHEAEFLADLAAHDAEVRAIVATSVARLTRRQIAAEIEAVIESQRCSPEAYDGLVEAAAIVRGDWP